MIITLIKKDKIYDTYLPSKIMGQFYINDKVDNIKRELLSVEGINGTWQIKSSKKVTILNDNNDATILSNNSLQTLSIKGENEHSYLYTYDIDYNLLKFDKYMINHNCSITFGRDESNVISYKNNFVSGNHFTINYQNGNMILIDNNSSNGVYVNSLRVKNAVLKPGDVIFVMGFKLIVGFDYICINNPFGNVTINNQYLIKMPIQEFKAHELDEDEEEKKYFFRSPRFKREVQEEKIDIDAPPTKQDKDMMPAILQFGPTMTMAMSTTLSSVVSINNLLVQGKKLETVMPTIIIACISLMGTLLWPILIKTYNKRKQRKKEKERQEKYKIYLHEKEVEINNVVKMQMQILHENNITYEECVDRINNVRPTLFERMSGQEDFLKLNIGIGNLPVFAKINGGSRHFTLEEDNLEDMMLKLIEKPHTLSSVPIMYSLIDNYFTGIIGNRKKVVNFTKRLILQLATLHSYDEVKFIYIGNENELEEWEFIKWLPHIWDNSKSMRYMATNSYEAKALSSVFDQTVETLIEKNQKISPRFIVIVTDKKLYSECDFLKHLFESQTDLGFSIITLFDKITDLPKECTSVIDIGEKETKIYNKNDISGDVLSFVSDCRDCIDLEELSIKLSNIKLDINEASYSLPNMLTFTEMYGVDKIEHLNVLNRWQNSDPINTLKAPIGINTAGDVFNLDLHEKYHGPHGLVAGMTGSGKSEFIITYILSLALNYHPDEVSFILIDYKGGGLTGAFENPETGVRLPHIAGTITNLSGNQIKRSLVSIQSELKRRQSIFNDARNKSGEGTIDIYKYQQLRREGVVSEAIPHLFIISDEFAELKSQQPEFMSELIQTARIGRSLGVHLILATQKPRGVVDDQIWSNSKFRICLKVQTAADSNEMLKKPDAAQIKETGRFYLQVGYDELFELGQSAWAGAPYDTSIKASDLKDEGVSIINNLGVIIRNQKMEKQDDGIKKEQQVVAIVKHLHEIAKNDNISSPRLWLNPIPNVIYTEDLEKKYQYFVKKFVLNPIIGEYDEPSKQSQNLLTLPLTKYGNAIIYGSVGSGKTTMIHTLCDSLMRHHSSEEVIMYIIDLGSGTLKYLEKAPHVGEVLTQADPDKVIRLFRMIKAEHELRKKTFADYGGSYQKYIEKEDKKIPNVVFIINNYSVLNETMDLTMELASLTRDCYKYGIYVILTSSELNAIRYTLKQNFKMNYTLQLNDASDYMMIVGKTKGLVPEETPGRGLFLKNEPLEFQIALYTKEQDQFEYIDRFNKKLSEENSYKAPRAPFLPDYVNVEYLKDEITNLEAVPIGVIKENLNIYKYSLIEHPISIISSFEIENTKKFTEEYINVLREIKDNVVMVFDIENILSVKGSQNCLVLTKDFKDSLNAISSELINRNNKYLENQNKEMFSKANTVTVIINGLSSMLNMINQETLDNLINALNVVNPLYKIFFILIDEPNGLKDASQTDWYQKRIGKKNGIWIGTGFNEQSLIDTNRFKMSKNIPDSNEMAMIVENGKEKNIKALQNNEL